MSETRGLQVENRDVSYEKRDVNPRAILWIGVAIIISAVIIHFAVWGIFDFFSAREAHKGKLPATLVNTKRSLPPQRPRLQTDAPADLQEMRAREKAALESYGWVDRQKGIVHIPVERAMELLVERGIPTEPTMTNPAESQTSAGKNVKTTVGAGQGKSKKQ